MTARIFDIKRFAIHDGPGIRTTVFFKGCPLRCLWCQNPEGIGSGCGLWINNELCIRCGLCISLCPAGALYQEPGEEPRSPRLKRERCIYCGTCVNHCPSRAIRRIDTEVSLEQLAEELLLDKLFFDLSGGGVTLSGGEPLAQPDFIFALLELLKKEGVHTCMETSLFAPDTVVEKLTHILDLLICDIKLINDEEHIKYTGESNKIILDNFKRFVPEFPKVMVRVPLIPGITTGEYSLRALGKFVHSCRRDAEIELLNYNWLSKSKYDRLEKPYFNKDSRAYSDEDIARFYMWVSPPGYCHVD